MPRDIPKNRPNSEPISKMEGVRRALVELGGEAKPLEIQEFLKTKFGIQMEPNMISNYKSSVKAASKSAIIRSPAARITTKAVGGITAEDVRAVNDLVGRIGSDQVRQLAEVLGK
jgi:hypothetical protein